MIIVDPKTYTFDARGRALLIASLYDYLARCERNIKRGSRIDYWEMEQAKTLDMLSKLED